MIKHLHKLFIATSIVVFVTMFKDKIGQMIFSHFNFTMNDMWVGGVVSGTILLVISIICMYLNKGTLSDYGMRFPKAYSISNMMFISITGALFVHAIPFLLSFHGYDYGFYSLFSFYTSFQIISLIVIYNPIMEELFFRGFIQYYLSDFSNIKWAFWGINLSGSTLLTAALFALSHGFFINIFNLYSVVIIFLGSFFVGLITGYYVEKTKSLLPPIMIHMIFNFVGYLFFIVK